MNANIISGFIFPNIRSIFGISVVPETFSFRSHGNQVLFSVCTRFPEGMGEFAGYGMDNKGGHILYWYYSMEVYNRLVHGQIKFQER